MTRSRGQTGFSLVETLVSVALMATALVALAQLAATATAENLLSRSASHAALLAHQKMEQLRAAPALTPSPAASLDQNHEGWVEFLDAQGRIAGIGSSPPPGTTFVRRWAVQPLAATSRIGVAVHVRVAPFITGAGSTGSQRAAGEARVSSVITREP